MILNRNNIKILQSNFPYEIEAQHLIYFFHIVLKYIKK